MYIKVDANCIANFICLPEFECAGFVAEEKMLFYRECLVSMKKVACTWSWNLFGKPSESVY